MKKTRKKFKTQKQVSQDAESISINVAQTIVEQRPRIQKISAEDLFGGDVTVHDRYNCKCCNS